jgi:cytochrome oxidase Cu insertion factor (SCO1/SenC/PrrC family)
VTRTPALVALLLAMLALGAVGATVGWQILSTQEYDEGEGRPEAPAFTLMDVDRGEISSEQLTGSVVALYMTNL